MQHGNGCQNLSLNLILMVLVAGIVIVTNWKKTIIYQEFEEEALHYFEQKMKLWFGQFYIDQFFEENQHGRKTKKKSQEFYQNHPKTYSIINCLSEISYVFNLDAVCPNFIWIQCITD